MQIYEKYADQGLEILGFPCTQFRDQEPGTNEEIKKFATEKYGAKFPMFSKIEVNGENTHEVYRYLRNNSELYDPATKKAKNVPWSWGKFLIDGEGKKASFYPTPTLPEEMIPTIKEMLESD